MLRSTRSTKAGAASAAAALAVHTEPVVVVETGNDQGGQSSAAAPATAAVPDLRDQVAVAESDEEIGAKRKGATPKRLDDEDSKRAQHGARMPVRSAAAQEPDDSEDVVHDGDSDYIEEDDAEHAQGQLLCLPELKPRLDSAQQPSASPTAWPAPAAPTATPSGGPDDVGRRGGGSASVPPTISPPPANQWAKKMAKLLTGTDAVTDMVNKNYLNKEEGAAAIAELKTRLGFSV
ncbi:hypothetical protein T492DRAFT_875848 [Pavlovales sp. CCMP2436]|nr:hypothetical protein T492DRAFT_875848 [Pavlovales sp. CCMP2436]